LPYRCWWVVDETNHAIAVTLPYGTSPTALVPTITQVGVSISPASGLAQDFSRTVTYTATAANGSTKPYTVTVTAVDATPAMSTYTVAKGTNAKAIAGLTNEVDYTFTVTCVDTSGNTSVGTTAMARPQGYSIGSRGARRRLHLLCQREFPQRRLEIHGDGYERGSQRSMGLVL